MSVLPSTPIPAGWYPDPAGSFQQRWWNGTSWTNDFAQYRPTLIHSAPLAETLQTRAEQPAFAMYAAQQAAATVRSAEKNSTETNSTETSGTQSSSRTSTLTRASQPQRPSESAPAFGLPPEDRAPLTSVARPNAANAVLIPVTPVNPPPASDEPNADWANYLPFAPKTPVLRGGGAQPHQHPERRYTASAWILALLPAVFFAIAVLIAFFLPAFYTAAAQGVLGVAFLLAGAGVAGLDRRALRRRGHDETASPAWSLLTPLSYLSVRAVTVARETGKGAYAPLILLLVVVAAIVASLILVNGLAALLTANALY